MRIALLLILIRPLSALYYAITSESTPPALATFFPFSLSLAEANAILEADVLVDATFEELSTATLTALSYELQVPLLVLGPALKPQNVDWTYFFGGTLDRISASLDTTLQCLGFRSANLVGDSSAYSTHLVQALRSSNSSVLYEPLFVSDADSVNSYVGRVMRPKGNRMTVLTTRPFLTKRILKAQFSMHIGGAGYANLLPLYSSLYSFDKWDVEDNLRNGNLIVTEREELSINTETEAAARLFAVISPYLSLKSSQVKTLLDAAFPSHVHSEGEDLIILNVQNYTRTVVGQVHNSTCTFTAPIHYLGNSTTIHTSSAPLPISANFAETDSVLGFLGTYAVTVAAVFAFNEINSSPSFLPNFDIEVWNFSAGVLTPDIAALARVVLPNKDKLGAAIMANIGSGSTMPLISYLRQHNITTPVVGAMNGDIRLSSQADFPNFIRVCLPDDFVNTVIVQTIKHLGWNKCALLVVDNADGLKTRSLFEKLLPSNGIEIVNDPAHQVISSSAKTLEEAQANFTAAFQHIIDTKCRVIVAITIVTWDLVPQVFYQLGMRKGDLIIVGRGWIAPLSFEGLDEEQIAQTAEIMHGSIQFSPEVFAGPAGKLFEQQFYEATHFPPLSFSCQYYDAAYTVGYALDWLLRKGEDFLNSTDMMKALRGVRFKGCTGLVYFEAHTNNRQSMRYTLDTLNYNASTGLNLKRLGVYDPSGMVLLNIDTSFVWGDGTTKLPSPVRESLLGCPFEDRLNQQFGQGQYLTLGVCLVYFVYSIIVNIVVWKRFKSPLRHLKERKELTAEDAMVMLGVFIDLIQSISLCSHFTFANPTLRHVLSAFIGDFAESQDMKDGQFSRLWIAVVSMNCGFLMGVVLLHWCSCCKYGHGLAHVLLELWVYLFAHWLLVPNIIVLLNMFDCPKGVANIGEAVTFETSYLACDCYETCWTSRHITMVSISAFTLLVYIAAAAAYQPFWQLSRTHLNVTADVVFMCVSRVLQLLLVTLFLGIRNSNSVLHASICVGISSLKLLFFILRSAYGYQRLRVRHLFATGAVLYAVIICLCHLTTALSELLLEVFFYAGIALILVSGEIYIRVKVPDLLYRPVGVNTFHLFKFAFKPATQQIVYNLEREFQVSRRRCSMRVNTVIFERDSQGRMLSVA